MSTKLLSASEMRRWEAWKRAQSAVHAAVEQAIEATSGLSGPEFAVLTRLVELGDGTLGQNRLAASLGWDRSRLSRQLTRMAARGLLTSSATSDGAARREVTATEEGRAKVRAARPAHAEAVRAALLDPTSTSEAFWPGVESLAEREGTDARS